MKGGSSLQSQSLTDKIGQHHYAEVTFCYCRWSSSVKQSELITMAEDDEIVLNFGDSLLYRSDIDLLKEPNWINDKIIAFCFE